MTVFSCLNYTTIPNGCIEYVHPWTDSCRDATLGLLFHAFRHSFKTYATLYLFTALMKRKKPSKKLFRDTILAILQSTAFLTTHAYGFSIVLCSLRRLTGNFNKLSVAFTPAFLSSLVAIHIERPSRRPILCLYVTNVATETLFRMAVSRGWLTPIQHGEVVIFTLSMASLLYRFRGNHNDDTMFSLLRFVVGSDEESLCSNVQPTIPTSTKAQPSRSRKTSSTYGLISSALQIYTLMIESLKNKAKSPCCSHDHSCLFYALKGGCKMFATGYGVQLLLKIVLSLSKIAKKPSLLPKLFVAPNVFNLGAFMGLFSATFRSSLCVLRWLRGTDSRSHAVPAGLLAGLAFLFYPDSTPALYVMWKALQIWYDDLVDGGYLPEIPHGLAIFYSLGVAILFHAGVMEPSNLRPTYFKFLNDLSNGQAVAMDRDVMEPFGHNTKKQLDDVIALLGLKNTPMSASVQFFGKALTYKP